MLDIAEDPSAQPPRPGGTHASHRLDQPRRAAHSMNVHDAALAWHDHGACVLPAAADGSKRPAVAWDRYKTQRPAREQLDRMLTGASGIGIVCGAVSDNIEMLEAEATAVEAGLVEQLMNMLPTDLWAKLNTYSELSPKGGRHWIFRVDGMPVKGNTKLARHRDDDGAVHVDFETRGEGGWTVIAPSNGATHPSGKPWALLRGTAGIIPLLTADEYRLLHACAATFDAMPTPPAAPPIGGSGSDNTGAPGSDFETKTTWDEILIPAGWTKARTRGDVTEWVRPGKKVRDGISATTGYMGDWLYVFTSSTELESERTYTKFGAYAALHHNGDYKTAAGALRQAGYGDKREPPPRRLHSVSPESSVTDEIKGPPPPDTMPPPGVPKPRKIILTDAPTKIKPVQWVWADRLPLGCLSLLAGREGIGKSVIAYDLAARITRGVLRGRWYGTPRTVIICATEDSWAHTITPRLMAAGADLTRVKLAAVQADDTESYFLVLPEDIAALEAAIVERGDVALLLLDPLISRLDASLDTYKDADVRKALEPLVALGDRTGVGILGLIHVNKGGGNDPLNALMASRAFSAVARAVTFAIVDRDDPTIRLLGCPKNNLGRDDLPSLRYSIEGIKVGHTDEGDVFAPKLVWGEEDERSVADVLADNNDHRGGDHSALQEAMDWLTDYLTENGGLQASRDVKEAAKRAQHTEPTLKRAAKRIKVEISQVGFPRVTFWKLPGSQPDPTTNQDQDGSGISRARGATTIDPTTTINASTCRPEGLFSVGSENQDQVIPPMGSESSRLNGSGHARAGANWTDSLPDPEEDPDE